MTTADSRFGMRPEEVAWKVLDGETIIINLMNGMYYSLPGTGSEAWELIESGRSVGEVTAFLSARYGVAADVVTVDLTRLVEELVRENLLHVNGAGAPAGDLPAPTPAERAYKAPALLTYSDMADLLALDPPTPGMIFPDFGGSEPAPK